MKTTTNTSSPASNLTTNTTTSHHHHQHHHHSKARSSFVLIILSIFLLVTIAFQFSFRLDSEDVAHILDLSKRDFTAGAVVGARDTKEDLSTSSDVAVEEEEQAQAHLRQQRQQEQRPAPDYHTVFSTSCNEQQHWESMVFFYHAYKVQQPGNVTRIASGCSDEEARALVQFHEKYIATMSPFFHLHLTPDFSRVRLSEGKHAYKYMNKPYGLLHWLKNVLGFPENQTSTDEDAIIILMDPDMVFFRPLVHDFTNEKTTWIGEPLTTVVRHGFPIAQQDGYLLNHWMRLNWTFIMNKPEGDFVPPPQDKEGPLHWNTGPPYLFTAKDGYRIAAKWAELAPRVLDDHPELFSEMYGFIIATVQLQLPFTLSRSIVVSTTESNLREGWPAVDALDDDLVCAEKLPSDFEVVGLHYCKRYLYGPWFFSKYRVKKNIMDCDKNLIRPPPRDVLGQYNYTITPPRTDGQVSGERKHVGAKQGKREVFMLCQLISAMNEALRYHKNQKCASPNLNETYTVHEDWTAY